MTEHHFQCFSCGAELGLHKRHHNYRVRTGNGVPVFTGVPSAMAVAGGNVLKGDASSSDAGTSDDADTMATSAVGEPTSSSTSTGQPPAAAYPHAWCAEEEVRLLEAVERFNLGNFEDVAKIVNPKRSVADVKEHYDKYYLRGRVGQICSRNFVRPSIPDDTTDYSTHASGATTTSTAWFSPPVLSAASAMHRVGSDDLRLLAYMPLRDDYEKEWMNDAEETVSRLLLAPDDDELDKAVKLALVDSYIRTVRERRRLKALARDYDLVSIFFKQEKPSTARGTFVGPVQARAKRLEKEIRESMRKYTQLMTADEFETLVAGLVKEHRLKERIEELQSYKKNGITTLEGRRKWDDIETPKRRKRGRKRLGLPNPNRKANLRWQRFKRWQKKLVDGSTPTTSQ